MEIKIKKILTLVITMPTCLLFLSFSPFRSDEVKNYLNTPSVLSFNDIDFKLSWSAHPSEIYYKQEYARTGEPLDHYNDLMMVEFINDNLRPTNVIDAQIKKLIERKKTDMVCNYQVVKNERTGVYILDFIMSESAGSEISTIEWDAYCYKSYKDKLGHEGVLLLGFSHRAYDAQTKEFLTSLKTYRQEILKKISGYQMPEIQLK